MLDEGHVVGNHTINHKSLPLLDEKGIEDEVVGLDRRFYQKYGKNMIFLRPPKGEYSEKTLEITSKLGYINVFGALPMMIGRWTVKEVGNMHLRK